LKSIHIGHHFFGSGNVGDDFVLSALLLALKGKHVNITCCVPFDVEPLRSRYPTIKWFSYTLENRETAIRECDIWLGLGGSPFQCEVSDWFVSHLKEEASFCRKFKKSMFFLGIGGQDTLAYENADLIKIMSQSESIWTRDELTYLALKKSHSSVRHGSDLSHILFDAHTLPQAASGRLTTALNFDYKTWNNMSDNIQALEALKPKERIWMAQESREIPGAEKSLFNILPEKLKLLWTLNQNASPFESVKDIISKWPSGEWLLSSRYHTTLASAWSGSKTVVLETNVKLKSAAIDCGFELVKVNANSNDLLKAFYRAQPADIKRMKNHATTAKNCVKEFCSLVNI